MGAAIRRLGKSGYNQPLDQTAAGIQRCGRVLGPPLISFGVPGRETLPQAFELDEPFRALCSFANNSDERVAIEQRPAPGELVCVITAPDKKERLCDPVKEWHGRADQTHVPGGDTGTGATGLGRAAEGFGSAGPPSPSRSTCRTPLNSTRFRPRQ